MGKAGVTKRSPKPTSVLMLRVSVPMRPETALTRSQEPPASAKTAFLLELARVPGSYYCLAQTLTGPGLAEVLFVHQPPVLLIDEIDRLSPDNVGTLNSLMATGIISETKFGKIRSLELATKVFAAGIRIERLPADLLSRFVKVRFDPYTEQMFLDVCVSVMGREKVPQEVALRIAQGVWGMSGLGSDIRQAVQIGRLSGGEAKRAEDILKTLRAYR